MRKFISRLTSVLWALTLANVIKLIVENGSINITLDVFNPQGILGWLFTLSIIVTVIDFLYFHLIHPQE